MSVITECRVTGKVRDIRVQASISWVVVTRAQVRVGDRFIVLHSDHKARFAMNLQADDTVDDLHPGGFHFLGYHNIRLFIVSCLELYYCKYSLAVFRCCYQRLNNG